MFGVPEKPVLSFQVVHSLNEVDRYAWNRLNRKNSPFLRHEFLLAMERHGAVGKQFGWLPRFILAFGTNNQLVGAMPLYEKDNSYGELVFDWSWADAYYRQGMPYYPKLVSAIPYTPANGDRLLSTDNNTDTRTALLDHALAYCNDHEYSSLHCLFPKHEQLTVMTSSGLQHRTDIQYHWFNENYADFDEFLSGMRNSKRKKIKQERRRVKEAGISFEVLQGNELTEEQWNDVHRFYRSTFDKKSGYATFCRGFFDEISKIMGEQIIIVLAQRNGKNIGAAINFRNNDTLYGRHWGCDEDMPGLHFETCYYQGIEYAIQHGIHRFEPGAQGEYKMSRGFMPVLTHSAHWIVNKDFRQIIGNFVAREKIAVRDYQQTLLENTPFKSGHPSYQRIHESEQGDFL